MRCHHVLDSLCHSNASSAVEAGTLREATGPKHPLVVQMMTFDSRKLVGN